MYTIVVYFEESPSGPVKLKRVKPGRTLLEVLLAKGINLRHDCGGICHCTTCRLQVKKGVEYIDEKSRREADFLAKMGGANAATRLACQCLLLEGSGDIALLIPAPSPLPPPLS